MGTAETVLFFALFVFSVILHEISHGVVARWFGDDTAYLSGRISLDPVKHIDPFMTVLLPLILYFTTGGRVVFGAAKPVPVNPRLFRGISMRRGMMWVALSGPVTNILLAALFAAGVYAGHLLEARPDPRGLMWLVQMGFTHVVLMNLVLACFNLIPIPPLDGGRVLAGLIPRELARQLDRIERFGFVILFGLIFLGALRPVFALALSGWNVLTPADVQQTFMSFLLGGG